MVVGAASGALVMVEDEGESGSVGSASSCAAMGRREDAWTSFEPDIVGFMVCVFERIYS